MRTFAAVATAGSFTAAAERLQMSTALASKYVAQLEKRLGTRLLHRTTRSLALTETGRVYLDRCQQVLDDLDALEASVQDRHADLAGRLIVTAPLTFGEMYLTGAVRAFLERHPAVSVDLRLTDRFVGLIDEGVDVAVRIAELEDSSLVARRLAPARVVTCASPQYLVARGRPSRPQDLQDHACVVDSNFRGAARWRFNVDGKPVTIQVRGRFTVNSARAVRDMLLGGEGIGLVPTYAVGEDIRAGRLDVVLAAFETLDLGVYAVYPHNRHLSAKVRAFVDFISRRFGPAPPWDRFENP